MKPNTPSANTRRAADQSADEKSRAKELEKMCQDREAFRQASPDWTAVIVRKDDKTEIIKWTETDKLNNEIL